MMVYDNGVYRPPTQEEMDSWETIPAPDATESDKAAEILNIILGGDSE